MSENFKQVDVKQEVSSFIVEVLQDPQTKKNPAMVAAIAELYEVIAHWY